MAAKVAIILEKRWRWWGKSDGGAFFFEDCIRDGGKGAFLFEDCIRNGGKGAFLFEDCIRNGGQGCVLGGFATGGGLNHGGIDDG